MHTAENPSLAPPTGRPAKRAWVEQIMGMPISIHLRTDEAETVEADVAAAFATLRKADDVFSLWKPDSLLQRVERGEADASAEPWLAEVTTLCAQAHEVTDGLFSARLPERWGQPTYRSGSAWRYDPTGVVKGWALAKAAARLRETGTAFTIGAGGDVVAGGVAGSPPWRIGVAKPYDAGGAHAGAGDP